MTNNNHNHQPCDFSETLVSYLYGEIAAAESDKFQAHAAKCVTCSAEIAGFSAVRSSIAEWRQEEFAPMASPEFELPVTRGSSVILTDESRSWLDGLREFFTPKVAIAAAGFAAVALVAGLTLVALNSRNSGNDDMLAKNSSINKNNAETNKVDNSSPEQVAEIGTEIGPDNRGGEPESPESAEKIRHVRQYTSAGSGKTNSAANTPKQKDKAASAQKQKTETLDTIYKDDEDDSLRLADLFTEADTDDDDMN
jgi:hypothetical protein